MGARSETAAEHGDMSGRSGGVCVDGGGSSKKEGGRRRTVVVVVQAAGGRRVHQRGRQQRTGHPRIGQLEQHERQMAALLMGAAAAAMADRGF